MEIKPPLTSNPKLDDIRKRDAEAGALWFKGPASFTALAARDRRALLAEVDTLRSALRGLMPEGWGDDDTMDHMPGIKAARLALAADETAAGQAPIAKVIVSDDGPAQVMLYAPGLPPGEHDLYCEPPASVASECSCPEMHEPNCPAAPR